MPGIGDARTGPGVAVARMRALGKHDLVQKGHQLRGAHGGVFVPELRQQLFAARGIVRVGGQGVIEAEVKLLPAQPVKGDQQHIVGGVQCARRQAKQRAEGEAWREGRTSERHAELLCRKKGGFDCTG